MSKAAARRFYTPRQMKAAAEWLANLEQQLIASYTEELRDGLPTLMKHARAVVKADPEKLFPGEQAAAREVLRWAPRHGRELHAALDILEFAPTRTRADFLTGDTEKRQQMISGVLRNGGVEDKNGRYPHQAQHDHVTAVSERCGFLVLDLLDDYREAGMLELRNSPSDITHPNARGYEIAADAIAGFLQEHAGAIGLD